MDSPVRVTARLDAPLSRGLWLVKWLLAIPHYIVLFFLWVAFVVLTVVAFFAILINGRYPRTIFDFNVGVLRWAWRVAYYSYGGLATDRYPPFTLAEVPDYPATLSIDYPERLSRGLALVKWWLLAIPHYMVVAIFVGGSAYAVSRDDDAAPLGLITLLVLFAGVALLFTGRYPKGIFDFVVGMSRWALRVAAYASLMTDHYPPFRLDNGPDEPVTPGPVPPTAPAAAARTEASAAAGPVASGTAGPAASGSAASGTAGPAAGSAGGSPVGPEAGASMQAGASQPGPGTTPPGTAPPAWPGTGPTSSAGRRSHWTAGLVVAVVAGALLLVTGLGVAVGGTVVAWADQTQRDQAGYLATPTDRSTTAGYGMRYDALEIGGQDWSGDNLDWLGTLRLQATGPAEVPLFIGIGPTNEVDRYLGQSPTDRLGRADWNGYGPHHQRWMASQPATAPGEQTFWVTSASGTNQQTITWDATPGSWTLVVMNADGSSGVDADVSVGATVPGLQWIWIGLLIGGAVALLAGAGLITLGVRGARR